MDAARFGRLGKPPVGNAVGQAKSVGKTALPEPAGKPVGKTPPVAGRVGKAVGFGVFVFLVLEDLLFFAASLFSKPVPKAVGHGGCDPQGPPEGMTPVGKPDGKAGKPDGFAKPDGFGQPVGFGNPVGQVPGVKCGWSDEGCLGAERGEDSTPAMRLAPASSTD